MIYFELFITFFIIGLTTFGGGYAMIPLIQENVTAKGWMSLLELTDFIAISEVTPGPFAINIATFIGNKMGGVLGAICSTLGVVLPSFIIILIVAAILTKFLNNKYVKGALEGVKPVVLALILSTALLFLIRSLFFQGNAINFNTVNFDRSAFALIILLFLTTFIYKKIVKRNLSPLLILLLSAILGLIIYI